MNKMREQIADIIYEARINAQQGDRVPFIKKEVYADQILALFDISKVEVEEDCVLCKGYGNHSIDGKLCKGASLRPATFDDLKKGGILKVKE